MLLSSSARELSMTLVLSSNSFSPTFFGFRSRRLENEYLVTMTEEARRCDLVANGTFALLMSNVSWQLWCADTPATGLAGVFLGSLCLHSLWAWVTTWPKSLTKTYWRTWLLILVRIHNIYCGVICDRALLYPYMREGTMMFMFHNILTASRALVFPMIALGMRIPFRYHVPVQVLVTACFTKLNQQLCLQSSLAMQANFSKMARLLSRIAGASTLLTPQINLPSIQDAHACVAVNELLLIAFATLLPAVIVFFLEAKSRNEFIHKQCEETAVQEGFSSWEVTDQLGDEECLSKAAGVSVFPVAVAVAALPTLTFLWNLQIVVDKLLPG